MLHSSDHLCGPHLHLHQKLHLLLAWGGPGLAALQMGPSKGRAEGDNNLPSPCCLPFFNAAQDAVGYRSCKNTLLVDKKTSHRPGPQLLFHRNALNKYFFQPVHVSEIATTHLVVGLPNFPSLPTFLWIASLPSAMSIAPLNLSSSASLLRVYLILAHITDKDVEAHQSQDRSLRKTTHHQSPGHRTIKPSTLAVTLQPTLYPSESPSFKPVCLQLRDKIVLQNHVKGLTQVKSDNICCLPFVHQRCHCITEGHHTCQAPSPLGEALKSYQPQPTPLSLRTAFQGISFSNYLNSLEFVLLKIMVLTWLFARPIFLKIIDSTRVWSLKPRRPPILESKSWKRFLHKILFSKSTLLIITSP